ncbi:MAG: amidohydrolase family protein, partial [Chloroflexota bacterium]
MPQKLPFPIVDTHLHIWDTHLLRYPWLDDVELLNRPYLLDEYNRACAGIEVERMVFVQAEADFAQFMREAEWVNSVADQDSRLQAIVAWAPLEKGDAARVDLEKLTAMPRVKGIRRIIQFEPDMEFCLQPDFIRGVNALPDYNLTFDICINHTQMVNTIQMVRQCPDVQFVVDHIAKPDIKHQVLDPWREHLKTFSEFPNVCCKLSGLVTEADHKSWTNIQLKPYIDHVIDCFGF